MADGSGVSLRQTLNRRLQAMKAERRSYDSHWYELQQFILPRRGRSILGEQMIGDYWKGVKKNQAIIDSTGTLAARTCASGMMSGITSPARPWFRLTLDDPTLAENTAVKLWLDEVRKRMLKVMAKSNFYNAFATLYEELAVFGTAVNLILEDREDVIRCYPLTVGEYYLANDYRLAVNTLYREFQMTVSAMVEQFGLENCSQQVQQMFKDGQLDKERTVCHCVEPNDARIDGYDDNSKMPYRSIYWEMNGVDDSSDNILSRSGFGERVFQAARWDIVSNDTYGRSPGMDALPFVKQLQFEQKQKAQGIAKQVNPPMTAPAAMKGEAMTVVPGGVTFTPTNGTQAGFAPAYQVQIELAELRNDIQDVRSQINSAFFADLFLMISQLDDVRTATEINERKQEKLLMLGPVLERLHDELLDPAIDRVFNIMLANGLFPEPPQELQGQHIDVEYISTLAQAQKAVETAGIERLTAYVGGIAGAVPSVLDKIDFDESVDEYGEALGVSPKIIRSDDVVAKIRADQHQQAQQQQAAAQAAELAKGAKTLSETELGGGRNALEAMVSQ